MEYFELPNRSALVKVASAILLSINTSYFVEKSVSSNKEIRTVEEKVTP